jgi:hypothetical protein
MAEEGRSNIRERAARYRELNGGIIENYELLTEIDSSHPLLDLVRLDGSDGFQRLPGFQGRYRAGNESPDAGLEMLENYRRDLEEACKGCPRKELEAA